MEVRKKENNPHIKNFVIQSVTSVYLDVTFPVGESRVGYLVGFDYAQTIIMELPHISIAKNKRIHLVVLPGTKLSIRDFYGEELLFYEGPVENVVPDTMLEIFVTDGTWDCQEYRTDDEKNVQPDEIVLDV